MTSLLTAFKMIELVSAQAQGFRGFKDSVKIDFSLGKNEFIGDNGKCKSSIGELIAWIVTGRNIAGKVKEINVTNKDSKSVIGILTFRDQNGNLHELERKQTSSMSIKLDYDSIPQKRLEELIPMDLFLCAFNPIYFLLLDAIVSRKTVASLFPAYTKEVILGQMDDYSRDILEKESFFIDQTNQYLKSRNEEISQLNDDRKWLEGYIGKLKEKVIIPEARFFNEAPLLAVQKQIDDCMARKPELKDIQALMKKRNELQQKLAQVQHQSFGEQEKKVELQKEKALLEQQLKSESEKQYTPFNPASIEAKLTVLRSDYKHERDAARSLNDEAKKLDSKHVHVKEGEQCPYCKQVISAESVSVLTNELAIEVEREKKILEVKHTEKKKTLEELEKEGIVLLEEISKSKEADEKNRQRFEETKAKTTSEINARLAVITKELFAIEEHLKMFEVNKRTQMESLQAEIQVLGVDKLEVENNRIESDFKTKISAEKAKLQVELNRLQKEKEEILTYEVNRRTLQKNADDQVKELDVRQKEMDSYSVKEEAIRTRIYSMKAFNAKKIELLNETIKKNLKDVEIRLQKTNESTGEVRDCFEIFYKDKELKICSTSETIRAGLEISNMVNTLSGVKFPVFVDNAESITSYDDPGFQTIEVRVVKDKPLTMIKGGKEVVIVETISPVKSSKPKSTTYGRTASAV